MKRVLILEDNSDTLALLKKLVHCVDAGAKIFLADSIEKAYVYAMKYTIDLFLVDLILIPGKKGGDMSGASFIQKVRDVKKYYFTPVIIVSSLYDTKQYLYAETHCFHFVEKPFDPEKMQDLIRHALVYQTKDEERTNWFYKMDGMVGAVPIGDIIYARSKKEEMDVITVRECIHISYKTCRDMLKELDTNDFEMCKRGVIVNRKFIKRVDFANRYIYLNDCDDILEIGSVMKKRFLKWYYEE